MLRNVLTCLSLAAICASGSALAADAVTGRARVLTGDTIVVEGRVIGLYGAAAPGLTQSCLDARGRSYACGAVSAKALTHHLREASVTCQVRETDAFGRALSICTRDKEDLSAWAIGEGHAVADRERPAYVASETPAWGRRKNLWAGSFDDFAHRKRSDYTKTVADAQPQDAADR